MEPAVYDRFWAQRVAKEQAMMLNFIPKQLVFESVPSASKYKKKKFM